MTTFRGVITGVISSLLLSIGLVGSVVAAPVPPPSAPYTALTMNFFGWGYIDGNFTYGMSHNTVTVYQNTPNGYALAVNGSRDAGWHDINVTPPIGSRFAPRTSYDTVVSFEPLATSTVLNISGDGQGCSGGATGHLDVNEAVYDNQTGLLTAFSAAFSVPCGGGSSQARGEIRFQSNAPYKAVESPEYRLQFGSQPVGVAGTPQQVTVGVFGTLPSTFGAATMSGDTGAFTISSNTCSFQTVSYGATCSLTITPTASAIGEQTAILTLGDDSFGYGIRRLLILDGFDPRDAELSPSYLDFGSVPAYDTSSPMTVTVTGTGVLPITFGQAVLIGEHPDTFRVTSDQCSGVTLATGQSCTMAAIARPTTGSGRGALLSLPDNSAAGSTPISLYVNGYITDRGTYYPMSPYRILDTRFSSGLVPSGGVVHLNLTSGGVPSDASTAVLNVTVTGGGGPGFLSVYPSGVPRPTVSSLNFSANWTGANSVTVKVGANGQIDLYNGGSAVHVIVDVFGYYSTGHPCCSGYMGGQYHPISEPVRLTDTREWNIGRIPGGAYIQSAAYWSPTINPHIRAFAVNITATAPGWAGYLTAWNGYEFGLPNTSTLNN
jgi:hypothetical protein